MSEEQTVERDEGIEAASEAFHEARVASDGVMTRVEVVDVLVGEEHNELYLCVEDAGEQVWIHVESAAYRPRQDMVERLGVEGGVEGLPGSDLELFVDRGEEIVRESREESSVGEIVEGVPVEEVITEGAGPFGTDLTRTGYTDEVGVEPDWAGDPGAFDRLLEAERALEYGEHYVSTREVCLEADGDDERVVVEAELGGEVFEWRFDVPDPGEFEDGELTRFVEAVGAGDPAGLDGHSVVVTMADAPWQGEDLFECDEGGVAILPRDELTDDEEETDDEAGVSISLQSTIAGALAVSGGGMVIHAVLSGWFTELVVGAVLIVVGLGVLADR